jgi:hypothetical protein
MILPAGAGARPPLENCAMLWAIIIFFFCKIALTLKSVGNYRYLPYKMSTFKGVAEMPKIINFYVNK